MSLRLQRFISGISGVARNAGANVPFEVNRRLHTVQFLTTIAGVATIASSVLTKLELIVNEKTVCEISPADLLNFNATIGLPDPDGILTLHFTRPDLADIINEEATAWDLYGERSFRIKATLADTANVSFEAIQYYDFVPNVDAAGNPAKIIIRLNSFRESFPAGRKDWTTLERSRPILRMFLDAAAAPSAVDVVADDLTVSEGPIAARNAVQGGYGISGAFFKWPLAFNYNNRLDGGLLVTKSLNVRVTNAGAQDVSCLMETFSTGFDGRA